MERVLPPVEAERGGLRSGRTGSAREMFHDRRAVDVDHGGKFWDRCAASLLVDEFVYLIGLMRVCL